MIKKKKEKSKEDEEDDEEEERRGDDSTISFRYAIRRLLIFLLNACAHRHKHTHIHLYINTVPLQIATMQSGFCFVAFHVSFHLSAIPIYPKPVSLHATRLHI